MSSPKEILASSTIVRTVRRDAAMKDRLYRGVAPFIGGSAFDSDIEEMSANEFAAKCLKKLGLPEASDPVTALDCYLAGKRHAADAAAGRRPAAMDSSGGSFMDRYIGDVA